MKKIASSLTNPEEKDIRGYVEYHEEEWGFGDSIYMLCVDALREKNPCDIKEKDVKGPIQTFLVNWGMMARVLGRLDEDWKSELAHEIQRNCKKLQEFRDLDLENDDIARLKFEIRECYDSLKKVIKTTATTKVLHILCPEFFPMWDTDIRMQVSRECRNLGKGRIDETSEGYYKFMLEMKNFLRKYKRILSELSKKHRKPKLRIVDEFLWTVAHEEQ